MGEFVKVLLKRKNRRTLSFNSRVINAIGTSIRLDFSAAGPSAVYRPSPVDLAGPFMRKTQLKTG
jgi:hypothetical protein